MDGWMRPYGWCDTDAEFSLAEAFKHPGPLSHWDSSGLRKRVCIAGGGIAGLVAAYELASLDHEITVLESSRRWGGRIVTHRFDDGTYGELGAMRIPDHHGCVDHYCTELGLGTRDFVSKNANAWHVTRGRERERSGTWDPASAYQIAPGLSVEKLLLRLNAFPLVPKQRFWDQFLGDFSDPRVARMEATSLAQLVDGALTEGTRPLSPEEWACVGNARGLAWIDNASVLFWWNVGALLDPAGKYEIIGGTEQLPLALLGALHKRAPRTQLALDARVKQVRLLEGGVEVRWVGDTGERTQQFDYLLCAMPAPAVARVDFEPPLSAQQREALRAVHYTPIAKTLVHCSSRFWETEDEIFGGSSVTDGFNQQTWYPSDNAESVPEDDNSSGNRASRTEPGRAAESSIAATIWRQRDARVSSGPGAFIGAYLWGVNAERFAAMGDAERTREVLRSLAGIHPDIGVFCDDVVHRSWGSESSPGGGGFAYFRPTEQRRYGELLCRPHGSPPRVYFAGEHDGIAQGWIQGAIQSSLAATISILQQP